MADPDSKPHDNGLFPNPDAAFRLLIEAVQDYAIFLLDPACRIEQKNGIVLHRFNQESEGGIGIGKKAIVMRLGIRIRHRKPLRFVKSNALLQPRRSTYM